MRTWTVSSKMPCNLPARAATAAAAFALGGMLTGAAQLADVAKLPMKPVDALKQAQKVVTYKKVGNLALELHIFMPASLHAGERRPTFLGIHGGGWMSGSAWEWAQESVYLVRKGMVAVTMTYRLLKKENGNERNVAESPVDCLADAKSAIRYLREHAAAYHIDPDKIVVAGASAGGHLASALATIQGYDDPADDKSISTMPNALVLFYPAFDLVGGWSDGRNRVSAVGILPEKFSPALLADASMPPTLILVGGDDPVDPHAVNVKFAERMKSLGRPVHVIEFAGRTHKLFEFLPADPYFQAVVVFMSQFLQDLGYIKAQPPRDKPGVPFEVLY